jgi:putative FmdB family regulatory protein
MPTYVYECAKCGDDVQAWQSFTDEPLKRHSGCGGRLTKVFQPVGIVFKGSGFHRTDSRTGSKRSSSSDGSSDGKDAKPEKPEKPEKSEKSDKSDSKTAASDATKDSKSSDAKKSAASAAST